MARKLKATLTFVKIFPATNTRTEEVLHIVANGDRELNVKISPIIDSWVKTDTNSNGETVYQCYLKSVTKGTISYVPKVDFASFEIQMSLEDVLKYIVQNKVKLTPTEEMWVNENDQVVGITHIVEVEGKKYEGYTVPEAINLHVNSKVVKDAVS